MYIVNLGYYVNGGRIMFQRTNLIRGVVLGLALFGLGLIVQPQKAEAAIGVQGTVTDSVTGNPIPNVTVSSVPFLLGTTASTTTDADGNYSLVLATGLYTINFTASAATGHTAASSSNLSLLSMMTLNKQLNRPTYSFGGTVRDVSSTALSNTVVTLTDYTGTSYEETTDGSGQISRSLLAGQYDAIITAPASGSFPEGASFGVHTPLTVLSNTTHTYQLPGMMQMSIHAKDGSGGNIAGQTVTASIAYPWPGSSGIMSGSDAYAPLAQIAYLTTNSSGIASFMAFSGMKASVGSICMNMQSIVYTVCNTSEFTLSSGNATATLQEPGMRTVSGRVTDASSNGVADVQVSVNSYEYGITVYSDSLGYYSASVPAGTYNTNLQLEQGTLQIMFSPVSNSVDASSNVTRNFQLPASSTVNLTARGTGNALLPDTTVHLSLSTGTGEELTGGADSYIASAYGNVMTNGSGVASFPLYQVFQSHGGDISAYLADMDAEYSNATPVTMTGNISVRFN